MFSEKFPVDQILIPEDLPRKPDSGPEFDELVSSIMKKGIIEPLIINHVKDKYYLVAGHRRLLAAKILNIATVPVRIITVDPTDAQAIALTENLFRKDLNIIEEAETFRNLETLHRLNRKQIAELVGKSQVYITQRIHVLAWPKYLQEAVLRGDVNYSVARELVEIDDPNILQGVIIDVIEFGCTARKATHLVKDYKKSKAEGKVTFTPRVEKEGERPVVKYTEKCDFCETPTEPIHLKHLRACPQCMDKILHPERYQPKEPEA